MCMGPLENQDLNDRELDGLLDEWKPPAPPARLRARVFAQQSRPWWRRIWTASIRIPAPVAACLLVALAFGAWQLLKQPRVLVKQEIKTERVEVPVVTERVVYRDRPTPTHISTVARLQPVTEL